MIASICHSAGGRHVKHVCADARAGTRPTFLHQEPRRTGKRRLRLVLASLLAVAGLAAADGRCQELLISEPILPIPDSHGQPPRKVALGKRLFLDPGLSADNTVGCAHCHRLSSGGGDGLPRSFGIGGAEGVINSPTVYNSGFNLAQFWDGRAATLEEQVNGPLHNPIEMGSDWTQVVAKLNRDSGYRRSFQAIYEDGITPANIRDAIASFERSLTTPGSRFDRWLRRGDEAAISKQERHGYALFKSYGCIACHQGVNVGGNMYHRMGTLGDYFADRGGEIAAADLGRFNVTGNPEDRHFFKVPSLRLATLTAPYFHDASAATLKKAIRVMGRYQLGRTIPDRDVAAIVAFLKSLVGSHPGLEP
jgi:cytochrome c peroxidase